MLGESDSLIRHWEKEFKRYIRPTRNAKRDRLFTQSDVANLRTIHYLVKDCRYTLEGAKMKLDAGNTNELQTNAEIVKSLQKIRDTLIDIRNNI